MYNIMFLKYDIIDPAQYRPTDWFATDKFSQIAHELNYKQISSV